MARTYGTNVINHTTGGTDDMYNRNNGHTMAWVSFGLSLANLLLVFFLNIPILFIVLGIICLVLAIADIGRSGKSIPATIAIVITIIVLVLSCLAWYNNAQAINQYYEDMQRIEDSYNSFMMH